jgi:Ni,Fe-hydrogenase I small subunit
LAPIVDRVLNRALPLTLLCVEGAIATGPDGTGLFDTVDGKPKRDLVYELCSVADYVLALGRENIVVGTRSCNEVDPSIVPNYVRGWPTDPRWATDDAERMANAMLEKVKV